MQARLAIVVLTLAVFAAFGGALRNDFVGWDDDHILVRNTRYQGLDAEHLRWMFTTAFSGHYQPLTWLSFAAESQLLWGVNPAGFHFTNIALHVITSIGFFFVARRVLALSSGDDDPTLSPLVKGGDYAVLGALTAAMVFAVHPLRVESVAWATERRDVLSGAWLVLAVFAYLRYAARTRRPWLWLGLSLSCCVLSLLSKAVGMTLPVVLLILDIYPLRRFRQSRRRRPTGSLKKATSVAGLAPGARILVEKLLYFIPASLAAVAALWAQTDAGALRTFDEHSLSLRIAQAFYGIVFYLGKTIWPASLVPLYEQSPEATPWEPAYVTSAIFVIVTTVALWRLRRRWPGLIAAWLIYVVLLSPVLGIAQAGPQVVADRYSYLPSMPVALLIGAGFARLWSRLRRAPRIWRFATALPTVLLLGCLCVLTRLQIQAWSNTYTLWSTTVAWRPNTPTAHANLAATLNGRGEFDRARDHALQALKRLPGNRTAHAAMARASLELGDLETAERHGRIALDIAEHVGRVDTPTMVGLAMVVTRLNRIDEAETIYRQVLELEPSVAEWRYDLASFLASQGRYAEAVPLFEETIRLDPLHGEAYYRLGTVWTNLAQPARAISVWESARSFGEALPAELRNDLEAALSKHRGPNTPEELGDP